MKKAILFHIFFLFFFVSANAQVIIDFEQLERVQNVTLKLRTIDKSSKDPIPYVSVYLIPQKDTSITHFAITTEKGSVVIKDIVPGKYSVNAEIIGYKPFSKEYNLRGWEKDLGDIMLEEDTEFLDAATISAIGNPIIIKKDTIEYNAAAYKVSDNAMLEDLLKKMPGMEVSSDGTVSVNGEKVDKITVGGKTFFFDDPTMAVKNLPAKIVEKIKVIDKNKSVAEFTGVGTNDDKEKVMDVQLKEEYQKGWFGNAKVSGGYSSGKQPLYSTSTLLSLYNEIDQLTIIGNAKNADEPGSSSTLVVYEGEDGEEDELAFRDGLLTNAQLGANLNSSRIKGAEINTSVNYNYTHKDIRERSLMTSFMGDSPDVVTDSDFLGIGDDRTLKANFFIKNANSSKFRLSLKPTLVYSNSNRSIDNKSMTSTEEVEKNSSRGNTTSSTDRINPQVLVEAGVKDIGKVGRSLMFYHRTNYACGHGDRTEYSLTKYEGASQDEKDLFYKLNSNNLDTYSGVHYVEPLGKSWKIRLSLSATYKIFHSDKDAFNAADASTNLYYSSLTDNKDYNISQQLYLQYEKDGLNAVFGANAYQNQNITNSENLGERFSVGNGEWRLNWAPYIDIRLNKNKAYLGVSCGGFSSRPSSEKITPTLNMSDPIRVTIGNTFLRPEFSQYGRIYYNKSNPENYSFFNLNVNSSVVLNQTVYASWFDDGGVRYAIPVNSPSPSWHSSLSTSYTIPFGFERRFKFNTSATANYFTATSYQYQSSSMPSIDSKNFNYEALMRDFWGENSSGEKFYNGGSGFLQSRTNTLSYKAYMELAYNTDYFEALAGAFASNSITHYSLDPRANMNTWNFNVVSSLTLRSQSGWELRTKGTYYFYTGYSNGYGDPNFIWNAAISKQFGSIMLSARVSDILNQKKTLTRVTSAEYVQDTYHNTLGRYILVGITFNFGKMNAKNNARAQNAMWQMMF